MVLNDGQRVLRRVGEPEDLKGYGGCYAPPAVHEFDGVARRVKDGLKGVV